MYRKSILEIFVIIQYVIHERNLHVSYDSGMLVLPSDWNLPQTYTSCNEQMIEDKKETTVLEINDCDFMQV